MNKENFRFYIKVRTSLDIQPTIIYDELYTVFGDEPPSFRTVARWSKWFREGREDHEYYIENCLLHTIAKPV